MKELRYGYRGFYFVVTVLTLVMLIDLLWVVVTVLMKQAVITEILLPLARLFLCYLYFYFKAKRKMRLQKKGISYEAQVIGVKYNNDISFHGTYIGYGGFSKKKSHPFTVTVRYENEIGNVLIDESKLLYYNISANPENFIVKVLVNPQNIKDRYIQLFLVK